PLARFEFFVNIDNLTRLINQRDATNTETIKDAEANKFTFYQEVDQKFPEVYMVDIFDKVEEFEKSVRQH
ncbi:4405_t:CDS:2, partial [Racocetra fulgida]